MAYPRLIIRSTHMLNRTVREIQSSSLTPFIVHTISCYLSQT